jgi:hypothetical protein
VVEGGRGSFIDDAPDRKRHVRVRPAAGPEEGAAAGVGCHAAALHGRGPQAVRRARPDVRHLRVAVAGAVAGLLAPELGPAAAPLAEVWPALAALAPAGAPRRALALAGAPARVLQEARRWEGGGGGRGAREREARSPVRVVRAGGRGRRGRARRRGVLPRVVAPVGGARRGGRRGGRRRVAARVERVPDGRGGGEVPAAVPRHGVRPGGHAHRRARQDQRGELLPRALSSSNFDLARAASLITSAA